MGFDTTHGLYYEISIGGKIQSFQPSYFRELRITESIFNLFPKIDFQLVNKFNQFYRMGLVNPENTFTLDIGTNKDDPNMLKLKNYIIEKSNSHDQKYDFSGMLEVDVVHSNFRSMNTISPAKGWEKMSPTEVLKDLISSYGFSTQNVSKSKIPVSSPSMEATTNIGNWLKPGNQSEIDFLKILKNRSQPQQSGTSKMFMWIDLDNTFNFKSLNSILGATPSVEIDFTTGDTELLYPTDFIFADNGLRYSSYDINSNFSEIELALDGKEEVKVITKPTIPNTNGASSSGIDSRFKFKTSQKIVTNLSHDLLPDDYIKSTYTNSIFNFPYRLYFMMKDSPLIKAGSIVNIIFPDQLPYGKRDNLVSGKYLITSLVKGDREGHFITEYNAVTNSVIQNFPDYKSVDQSAKKG